jgi:hypothetical protein
MRAVVARFALEKRFTMSCITVATRVQRPSIHTGSRFGNAAAWGAGGAGRQPSQVRSQEIRVKVLIEGDAGRAELDEIIHHAQYFSSAANTSRNPMTLSGLSDQRPVLSTIETRAP